MSAFAEVHEAARVEVRDEIRYTHRLSTQVADRWCELWEVEAAERGHIRYSPGYWHRGVEWILEQLSARK
jgi:hypothetical protein